MPLSPVFDVSFTGLRKDLIEDALNKLLSQHYDKCVLRQFVAVFIKQVQELYDACIDMQEQRIVYNAEAVNLDALGRIVGEDRRPWSYDDSTWVFFDRQGQGFDSVACWCIHAPLGANVPILDDQYRVNIIAKAIKNHTLVGSVDELHYLVGLLLGIDISFVKTGPNTVDLVVSGDISTTNLTLLTQSFTDNRVDEGHYIPYPATLSFSGLIIFTPKDPLRFDDARLCVDYANCAVGVGDMFY